jgi:hypothetical protein
MVCMYRVSSKVDRYIIGGDVMSECMHCQMEDTIRVEPFRGLHAATPHMHRNPMSNEIRLPTQKSEMV